MFAITSRIATRAQPSIRAMSVISGPPTVKISKAEKMVHAACITVGLFAIPAWVLVNIRSYRGVTD